MLMKEEEERLGRFGGCEALHLKLPFKVKGSTSGHLMTPKTLKASLFQIIKIERVDLGKRLSCDL